MPLLEDAEPVAAIRTQVGMSVPVEVFWASHAITTGRHYRELPNLARAPKVFGDRLREIWGRGGPSCFGEALIIAEKQGVLFTPSIDDFQAALREATQISADLPLASETAEDRRQLLDRCARLAANAGFRRRYTAVIGELWSVVAEDWESAGRRLAEGAAERLRRASAGATTLDELLSEHQPHLHDPWYGQAAAALAAGRLSVTTSWLGGKFLAWDLEHTYLIGVQAIPHDEQALLRRESHRLASRLKVLADPTRLGILVSLSRRPATVTELARAFSIAQPTASAHLKLLREADLVTGGREDGRPDYAADRRAVSMLLKEVEHMVVEVRPPGPTA
jgi:DNA-binding transcriptional ArsR family regulator